MDPMDADESRFKNLLEQHGYVLRQQIGYGSFGDVFSVMPSSDSNTKFAVKRLLTRRDILEDEYAMMEINSLLHLQHQNIIPLQEVILTKKVACIVMELAPLGNLEMFFKTSENDVSIDFITNIFCQLLNAVDFCHSFYLAHRDINPSNVLVFHHVLVKLADFGLCFQCKTGDDGDVFLCSDYLGHDSYLAPEVKKCKPFHAMPADIWSLGCVLRYLATNCHVLIFDQSTCLESVANNSALQSIDDAGTLKDVNSAMRHTVTENKQKCPIYNEREKVIKYFVTKLCQNLPQDRPSVNEALSCWENAVKCLTIDACHLNSTPVKGTEKEE